MAAFRINENRHHKRQENMFNLYRRLTWAPSTAQGILAILGGEEEGYMAILIKDVYKKC